MDKDLMKIKLLKTLEKVEIQIQEVERVAADMGGPARNFTIEPEEVRDRNGNFLMIPLLAARAQVLHALVLLEAS